MAQFIRHPVVFDDRIARSQQLADIPLRPEEILELALGIIDRPDMNRVPEGCAILAIVQDVDHGIDALFDRAAQARHGRGRGLLPLEKTAIAPDDFVDRIAREFDEGVVAIDDGAIGLMGIGNALRHPGLRGGLQEQLIGGETQRGETRGVPRIAFVPACCIFHLRHVANPRPGFSPPVHPLPKPVYCRSRKEPRSYPYAVPDRCPITFDIMP